MDEKPTYERLKQRVQELEKINTPGMDEEKYQLLFNSTNDAIFVHQPSIQGEPQTFIEVNETACRLYGYTKTELLKRTLADLMFGEYREKANTHINKTLSEGKNIFNVVHQTKSGKSLQVEISSFKFLFNDKQTIMSIVRDVSDRKQLESALRDSEEKYRILFDQSLMGIYFHDLEGHILDVNHLACIESGYTKEELLCLSVFDFHPDSEVTVNLTKNDIQNLWKKWEPGERHTYEGEHQRKDGTIFPIEVSTGPVKYKGEKYIIAIIQNITARKQAERKQKKLKAQLSNAMELAKIGHWEYDVDKDFFTFNDQFYKIFRTTAEQFGGYTMSSAEYSQSFVYPEDRGMVEDEIQKSIETSDPNFKQDMEHRIIYADGEIGYINVRYTIVKDIHGRTVKTFGANQDITKQKKVEQTLQESEEKFRLLFENSSDAHVLYSGGRFIDCNNSCIEMLGFNGKEQLLSLHPDDISPPYQKDGEPSKQKSESMIALAFEKGSHRFGWLCQKSDGSELILDVLLNVIKIQGEDIIHGVWRDITRLEKLQEQILKTQKMETIGNLAGGIAHDFNNILFPIVGMSELLLEDLPPGSGEWESAEEIFKAGKRGSDLVKQILAFSRQSEHKMMPTRIQNVLEEVIKLSRSTIPTYIEIKQDIQKDCGMVLSDPSQIHQIGMNIITNAYHAIETTGGQISITLKQTIIKSPESFQINLEPGAYAAISISDTGHGMSKELVEKIFDPYFTTKAQGKGTGLGLAVVYGIVKEHGGDIRVSSEIGEGSTFDIYLPLMKKNTGTDSIPEVEIHRGGHERILLVDDEESIAKLEKQMLERMGYKVTSRLHSVEALEAFKASPLSFDLVVTDMSMPNIPGDELARKIKSIRSDVSIIICTGFSERINENNLEQMGIDGLLMKPIVKSDLAKTVRSVLDRAQSKI